MRINVSKNAPDDYARWREVRNIQRRTCRPSMTNTWLLLPVKASHCWTCHFICAYTPVLDLKLFDSSRDFYITTFHRKSEPSLQFIAEPETIPASIRRIYRIALEHQVSKYERRPNDWLLNEALFSGEKRLAEVGLGRHGEYRAGP